MPRPETPVNDTCPFLSPLQSTMFSKLKTAAVLAAAGAAGGPYVASETEWGRQAMTSISSMHSGDTVSASTSVDASLTGYANHAHHEVENLQTCECRQISL